MMTFRFVTSLVLMIWCSVSMAHHFISDDIDMDSPVLINGKVTEVEWSYPHVLIHVLDDGSTGQQKSWLVQVDNPGQLLSRGIRKAELESLPTITVTLFLSEINNCQTTCFVYGLRYSDPYGGTHILSDELESALTELRFGN